MSRTTSVAVQSLIEVDASISDLSPYIATASVLVDRVAAADATVSADLLEMIERWLAAHFVSIRSPAIASESAGPVSASYQYSVGQHLDGTMYGQQALLLDPTGVLAAVNLQAKGKKASPRKASIMWLGKEADT